MEAIPDLHGAIWRADSDSTNDYAHCRLAEVCGNISELNDCIKLYKFNHF